MALFTIMNPLANTPVFLALAMDDDHQTSVSIARRGILTEGVWYYLRFCSYIICLFTFV